MKICKQCSSDVFTLINLQGAKTFQCMVCGSHEMVESGLSEKARVYSIKKDKPHPDNQHLVDSMMYAFMNMQKTPAYTPEYVIRLIREHVRNFNVKAEGGKYV